MLQVRREAGAFKGRATVNTVLLLVSVLLPPVLLINGWFDFEIPPAYFHFSNPVAFLGHSQFSAALLITTVATFINCVFTFVNPARYF